MIDLQKYINKESAIEVTAARITGWSTNSATEMVIITVDAPDGVDLEIPVTKNWIHEQLDDGIVYDDLLGRWILFEPDATPSLASNEYFKDYFIHAPIKYPDSEPSESMLLRKELDSITTRLTALENGEKA